VARVESEVFGLTKAFDWTQLDRPPVQSVGEFGHLLTRVDRDAIDALIEANRSSLQTSQ
jgi:hypothetical protein